MNSGSRNFGWPGTDTIEAERINAYFELLLGRQPTSDTECNTTLSIARRFQNPRLETVRNLIQKQDFFGKNRDMLPLFFDLMVRARIFGGHAPPKTNLFCVGAARSGTTTLSVMLDTHSQVYVTPVKETNFFSHFSTNISTEGFDSNVYQFYFSGWTKELYLGDFSPNYLRDRRAIDGLHAYNSNAKIIICLRDPVERAISSYFYTKEIHREDDIYAYFATGIKKLEKDLDDTGVWFSAQTALRQGLYCSDISHVKSKFNEVRVVEFSEFKDPHNLYNGLCSFLSISPEPIEGFMARNQKINASHRYTDVNEQKARDLLREFYSPELANLHRVHGIEFQSAA